MLDDGLAAAERARDRGGAAFGDREEGVDDPLAGDQRCIGRDFFLIRAAAPDRPFLQHGQFGSGRPAELQPADRIGDRE